MSLLEKDTTSTTPVYQESTSCPGPQVCTQEPSILIEPKRSALIARAQKLLIPTKVSKTETVTSKYKPIKTKKPQTTVTKSTITKPRKSKTEYKDKGNKKDDSEEEDDDKTVWPKKGEYVIVPPSGEITIQKGKLTLEKIHQILDGGMETGITSSKKHVMILRDDCLFDEKIKCNYQADRYKDYDRSCGLNCILPFRGTVIIANASEI